MELYSASVWTAKGNVVFTFHLPASHPLGREKLFQAAKDAFGHACKVGSVTYLKAL